MDVAACVSSVRKAFDTGGSKTESFRRSQLTALYKLLDENESRLMEALSKDLHKSVLESLVGEVNMIKSEIALHLENLREWMKPVQPQVGFVNKFDRVELRPEPFGVVLILGAWNYPVQLTLLPLVGAISAGNAAIVKPSELSAHCADLLAELVPKYLDKNFFWVIVGGPEAATAVLKERFDKILYTGSGNVGRIVLEAAAKHLTPVALELGGKSPCLVDKNCDLTIAARRIAWGRLMNAGQTCIAPDYVLCEQSVRDRLVAALQSAISEFYSKQPKESADFGRIVNARHFKRVQTLIQSSGGKVVIGGDSDEKQRYIAPTVIVDVSPSSPVMQEEIFGPVLPVLTVRSMDEAIEFVNARDKPLALYVFSNDNAVCEKVVNRTQSGGVTVNDCLMHSTVPALPFGGVGASGMGSYHGKYTFDLFTFFKPCLSKKLGMESVNSLRYPPHNRNKADLISFIAYKDPSNFVSKLFKFGGIIRASL